MRISHFLYSTVAEYIDNLDHVVHRVGRGSLFWKPNPPQPTEVFIWPNSTHHRHSAIKKQLFHDRYISNENMIFTSLCVWNRTYD